MHCVPVTYGGATDADRAYIRRFVTAALERVTAHSDGLEIVMVSAIVQREPYAPPPPPKSASVAYKPALEELPILDSLDEYMSFQEVLALTQTTRQKLWQDLVPKGFPLPAGRVKRKEYWLKVAVDAAVHIWF